MRRGAAFAHADIVVGVGDLYAGIAARIAIRSAAANSKRHTATATGGSAIRAASQRSNGDWKFENGGIFGAAGCIGTNYE